MVRRLLVVLLALVMLGSVLSPVIAMETSTNEEGLSDTIQTKLGRVIINGKDCADFVVNGKKYTILVKEKNSKYMVRILDSNGREVWREISEQNPIEYLKRPYTTYNLPIPPDANINIYPNKYTYTKGESGRITMDVDNGGVTVGYTSYYILIPEGVTYKDVLDGPEPTGKIHLTEDNNCYIVPEYGIVCGHGELLVWQAVHLSGYKKQVVLSVEFNTRGTFKFEAGTAVVDAIIGWGDASSDSFRVSVI